MSRVLLAVSLISVLACKGGTGRVVSEFAEQAAHSRGATRAVTEAETLEAAAGRAAAQEDDVIRTMRASEDAEAAEKFVQQVASTIACDMLHRDVPVSAEGVRISLRNHYPDLVMQLGAPEIAQLQQAAEGFRRIYEVEPLRYNKVCGFQ